VANAEKYIPFEENSYKIQLYDIIKRHKKRHIIYKFDVLVERHGHNILVFILLGE
jgi:hypothetical protein